MESPGYPGRFNVRNRSILHDCYSHPNIRNELNRIHLVTMATSKCIVTQRSELTPGQRHTLGVLELPVPPLFFEFTPVPDADPAPAP